MKKLIIVFPLILFCSMLFSQERDINSLLDQTLRNRGLTREDISIPIEFFSAAEKNPTNESKLILPLVKDMMTNPLRSETWLDSVGNLNDSLTVFAKYFLDLLMPYKTTLSLYNFEGTLSSYIKDSHLIISLIQQEQKGHLNNISIEQRRFLSQNILSILEDTEESSESNYHIIKFNQQRYSSIITSKNTMDVLSELKKDYQHLPACYSNFSQFWSLYQRLANDKDNENGNTKRFNDFKNVKSLQNDFIQGDLYY